MGEIAADPMSTMTFEEALSQAKTLVSQYENDDTALDQVAQLLSTPSGARGFLVVFLTAEETLADEPSPELLAVLAQAPNPVAELLVKNLVMSTAMTVAQTDPEEVAGSQKVARRTYGLLAKLPHCKPQVHAMYQSLTEPEGSYSAFLKKWSYNEDQKRVMAAAIAGLV
jgi:hypothetical protein